MKFASFPKFALLLALAGALALVLTGCGTAIKNTPLTPGNWAFTATSTKSANAFTVGGNLTQTGTSVAGTMYIVGSNCGIDPSQSVKVTGPVNGSQVSLATASTAGQV